MLKSQEFTENEMRKMTLQETQIRQRRERAHALFCSLRPWIRREAWLPSTNHVRNAQARAAVK